MKERLRILHENSVIDDEIYESCVTLHDGLMSEQNLTEINAYQVALTHLAMALQRIKKEEVVSHMDDAILNEIKQDERFGEVEALTNQVLSVINAEIPDSEVQYLWLHFMTVLKEKGDA